MTMITKSVFPYIVLTIVSLLVFGSCTPAPESKEEVNEIEDWDSYYKEARAQLVASYLDTFVIDTLFGGYCRVQLQHFSLNDSAVHISDDYVWESEGESFTTHNYASRLLINTNNTVSFSTLINKSTFNQELEGKDGSLKDYATLSHKPYLYFDSEQNAISIHYSLSIPITDIGIPVEFQQDLSEVEWGEELAEKRIFFKAFLQNATFPKLNVDFKLDSLAQYQSEDAFTTHIAFRADTAVYLRKGIDNGISQAFYFVENGDGYDYVKLVDASN